MIELTHISKSYGSSPVLQDFNKKLVKGKIYCIIGESGCGKTTLLRIASGLLKPDSGTVSTTFNQGSYIFQENRLISSLTCLENLSVLGIDKARAADYLQRVGLKANEKQFPTELSGGMKRRLCIARALAFPADIYFFDEPLSALDEDSAIDLARLIRNELKDKTALIVTHNLNAAKIMADEIIELQHA